ncbi:hypothetical protein [Mesorhizobium sp.]|uniref:DUF6953 family protein n=1 Tax=Mesorhizobium sp. TaxID=1871066 RepID=UPI000FE4D2C5|nr:hypothetical protein [Mesorhizobium sp.]RWH32209.1 MAG: hypothetical protein EOQ76_03705 [Mesorhizobium sp.]RWH40835.1 MAG: hypothetical protein EOQ79_02650 [Mesorhizobium sp.]TIM64442.1 MAG: hypothetical protein E5Y52_19740 [Mesorhizobium sp.]TIR61458.1 MAG: hypothetical protein E5X22_04670 [Mesorhizobium sp.]TIR70648.1 MAG: hypothetical protein E5X24_08410 [Mesorhizobium sp.]
MTPTEGAQLMLAMLNEFGELYQYDAANRLHAEGGEDCIYFNAQGNVAIKQEVLKEFKRLTPDYVWLRSSTYWRRRQEGDQPGRMQPY